MEDIKILDNYVDKREFRNYIHKVLIDNGYSLVQIEDVRIADKDKINDNDIRACKEDMVFTIQTFLNKEITEKEINETIKDIEKEKVSGAILFCNTVVNSDIVEIAKKNNIIIWDRDVLLANL